MSDSNTPPVPASSDEIPSRLPQADSTSLSEDLKEAANAALNEEQALALLKRNDLPPEALEVLSKNGHLVKSRKVKRALVAHPRTPRHISLSLIRQLFTFDLMEVALAPVTPADVKLAADEALINRLKAISLGERLSLARRASGRVAGRLILDSEPRVVRIALENGRLTEAFVVRALMRSDAPAAFVHAVCHHPSWSQRREVRMALLHNENTPLASALEFARSLPAALVRDILRSSRLPSNVKGGLLRQAAAH